MYYSQKQISMILSALLVVSGAGEAQASISFTPLGDLSGGFAFSSAYGVSADGSTVVGYSYGSSGDEAFRWTPGAMVGLGYLDHGSSTRSFAAAVSANGEMVVGFDDSPSGRVAFRWMPDGGGTMEGLGDLHGGSTYSQATGVSSDGSTVVGYSKGGSGDEAFRWTAGGGMEGLGHLENDTASAAYGISGDGMTIVGYSQSSSNDREAFRWTAGGGGTMEGLGYLEPDDNVSLAYAASADGSTIVGYSQSSNSDREAFRWTLGVMEGLGDLPGGSDISWAQAVSGDGSTVVGAGHTNSGYEAFIWDPTNEMRRLKDVLTDGGVDMTGWTLSEATGISPDGRYIVGNGVNLDGNTEAWLVDLGARSTGAIPEPTSFAVWSLLALVVGLKRCQAPF